MDRAKSFVRHIDVYELLLLTGEAKVTVRAIKALFVGDAVGVQDGDFDSIGANFVQRFVIDSSGVFEASA